MKFDLENFCEPLMEDESYFSKKMFGGLSVYYGDLMRFVLTEKPGDRTYRDKKFKFDVWNGVLVCTSREHHNSLQKQWPQLIQHPVLGKWLYLPMIDKQFEEVFIEMIESTINNDERIGIVPGRRK